MKHKIKPHSRPRNKQHRGLEKGSSERIFLNPTSSTSSPFDRWFKWAKYWKEQTGGEEEEGNRDDDMEEDVKEEMEVIKAIFGDDVVINTSRTKQVDSVVEVGGGREEFWVIYSIPLTTEEAGDERTGCDDVTIVEYFCGSPYPNDTVIYAVKGGGLGGVHIREVYGVVEDDDVGVCRVFEHLEKVKQAIGTVWERVGEREGVKEEEDRKAFKGRRVKEKEEMEKERKGKGEVTTDTAGCEGGGNGGEKRINAKDRLGAFGKKTTKGGGRWGTREREMGRKLGSGLGKAGEREGKREGRGRGERETNTKLMNTKTTEWRKRTSYFTTRSCRLSRASGGCIED